MTSPTITTLDLRVIEPVLEMGNGYVLDFTDAKFSTFFQEHGVPIDDPKYSVEGQSKAKRLRYFLKTARPELAGKVLGDLLEHRFVSKPEGLKPADVEGFQRVVARLGGAPVVPTNSAAAPENELLRRVFRPDEFAKLPMSEAMTRVLVDRMDEARRCIDAKAHLAAIILCGSVLEGMCLGYGSQFPERANRAFNMKYKKAPAQFHDWKLKEWIEVLASNGDLSQNVEKFGQALRDFRNYVHPAEQLAYNFSPDSHTARIGFQVVVAAVEDLVKAAGRSRPTT